MFRDAMAAKRLSKREMEIAEEVVRGLANKEVATKLFVTEKTVKFHLTNIYKKLQLKSRAQLIVWASQNSVSGIPAKEDPPAEPGPPDGILYSGFGNA